MIFHRVAPLEFVELLIRFHSLMKIKRKKTICIFLKKISIFYIRLDIQLFAVIRPCRQSPVPNGSKKRFSQMSFRIIELSYCPVL